MQMCGRAGRPPFNDTGTVIIMTRRDTVITPLSPPFHSVCVYCFLSLNLFCLLSSKLTFHDLVHAQVHLYENLLNGCEIVESQ